MIDFANIEKYRENNRIEAKRAVGGLPESIWETYSAFANTLGGVILLGVEERRDKTLHAVELPNPAGLIEEFRALLLDPRRVSSNILTHEDVTMEVVEGKHIIAIHVPRAPWYLRPVYIGGDPHTGSYFRDGEGDYHCTAEEVDMMMRASAPEKHAIADYLTSHIRATSRDIADALGLRVRQVEAYLDEMILDEVVIVTEATGEYQLKA